MYDFKIEEMYRHPRGFTVAIVRSNHTQNQIAVHDRWGSWMAGDPEAEHAPMKDLTLGLPQALQDFKVKMGDKLRVRAQDNPFVKKATQKQNPFVAKASKKPNPFIAKAKGK